MRESVGKHGAGDIGDFDLPGGGKSCLLEAEVEAADACEQAADGGFVGVFWCIHCVLSVRCAEARGKGTQGALGDGFRQPETG